jgi:hypothetical protein
MKLEDLTLDVVQTVEIKAAPEKVFAAVLHRLGKGNTRPDGQSMQMLLEPRAGGGTGTAGTGWNICGDLCR